MKTIIALSGGKDSTALALRWRELNPDTEPIHVCTPTGNESPEMLDWWLKLGAMLGTQIKPVMEASLVGLIEKYNALPNFRQRWCTREIKIEPYRRFLQRVAPCHSLVGLRADEEGRAGGAYDDIDGVTMRFPLREWGWGIRDVSAYLVSRGVQIPARTDCEWCYHQRLIEWWRLWRFRRESWEAAKLKEAITGHTFRSPGRDTWPSSLMEMEKRFEAGEIPKERSAKRVSMESGSCSVCSK